MENTLENLATKALVLSPYLAQRGLKDLGVAATAEDVPPFAVVVTFEDGDKVYLEPACEGLAVRFTLPLIEELDPTKVDKAGIECFNGQFQTRLVPTEDGGLLLRYQHVSLDGDLTQNQLALFLSWMRGDAEKARELLFPAPLPEALTSTDQGPHFSEAEFIQFATRLMGA